MRFLFASKLGNLLLLGLLTTSLATAAEPCKPISAPLTFEKLERALRDCRIPKIEDLLPLLPPDFRSRYVLAYASRSLQEATPKFPRVIMFGLDATIILAFGGSSELAGYELLETIEFDHNTKQFIFRSVTFPGDQLRNKSGHGLSAVISEPNPQLCMNCHRQELRPNWDTYAAWPGVYGSVDDAMPAAEKKQYAIFQGQILGKEGRYRFLEDPEKYPDNAWYIDYVQWRRPNLHFNWLLSLLNSQANARAMKDDPRLHPFRYAMLASVSCDDDYNEPEVIEELIPREILAKFPRTFQEVSNEVDTSVEASYEARDERQCQLLRRLSREILPSGWECKFLRKEIGATASTSRLKYIIEGAGVSFPQWSMELGSKNFVFFAGVVGRVGELDLFHWKELLDPEADRELYQIYHHAWEDRSKWGNLVFESGREPLCQQIRKKSLQTLSHYAKRYAQQ